MKLYFAVITGVGNVRSFVAEGEPIDLLKRVFISLPTGEFNLGSSRVQDRIQEIDDVWAIHFSGLTAIETIDRIAQLVAVADEDDFAAVVAERLMIWDFADEGVWMTNFLADLRGIFEGTETNLSTMSEELTALIVRIN